MNKKMYTSWFSFLGVILTCSYFPVQAGPLNLESGINGNTYILQGIAGTAGVLGVDYTLGSYLAGGNGSLLHGFPDKLAWLPGFVAPNPPSGTTEAGAMEATDHNLLQGEIQPIIVDLGERSKKTIVFSSSDHLGVDGILYNDPEKDLWNKVVEALEFTVYGSNNLIDAMDAGVTADVFGTVEAGIVPAAGIGSSFEQAKLDFIFEDGWFDFGNADEGDDYASVWKFSQAYQYIAVYSNSTDPLIGDGFQSDDNELDAVGRFKLNPPNIPEPNSFALLAMGLAGFSIYGRYRSRVSWKVISGAV